MKRCCGRRTTGTGVFVSMILAVLSSASIGCGSGAGLGEFCDANADCRPGLYCEPATSVCSLPPGSSIDSGAGTDAGSAPICGNATCEPGESCTNCDADCGICAACGDGVCEAGESCKSCDVDCGKCPPDCGNGVCEPWEDCDSCSDDCGTCPGMACGNGVQEAGEQCDDNNLFAGDGCGPACNLENPCIRSPLPTPTPLGDLEGGDLDEGTWHLDISPGAFNFQGQMRSLFAISTNGYIRPGLSGFLSVTGYENRWTDVDQRFVNGESMIAWLGGDGDMSGGSASYDLDPAHDRLVLHFDGYAGWAVPGSSADVQMIFHLSSGSFEILYLGGNFEPSMGRDWSIGVSEPNLIGDPVCNYSDFANWMAIAMGFPFGCIANHTSGAPPPGGFGGAHYAPLVGQALCFVKTTGGYEVRIEPIVP